jgi:hypothetical protein
VTAAEALRKERLLSVKTGYPPITFTSLRDKIPLKIESILSLKYLAILIQGCGYFAETIRTLLHTTVHSPIF